MLAVLGEVPQLLRYRVHYRHFICEGRPEHILKHAQPKERRHITNEEATCMQRIAHKSARTEDTL